jgi:hypothetical protein
MSEAVSVAAFDPIMIERYKKAGGLFRARTCVPPTWGHLLPEVKARGSATPDGEWIETYGPTPEEAMRELFHLIGQLCVRQHGGSVKHG